MPKNSNSFARDVEIHKEYSEGALALELTKKYDINSSCVYRAINRVQDVINNKGNVKWLSVFSDLTASALINNGCNNPYKLDDYIEEYKIISWKRFGRDCCEELCNYLNRAYMDLGYKFGVIFTRSNKSYGVVRNDHPAFICSTCYKRYCKRRDEYVAFGKRNKRSSSECGKEVNSHDDRWISAGMLGTDRGIQK